MPVCVYSLLCKNLTPTCFLSFIFKAQLWAFLQKHLLLPMPSPCWDQGSGPGTRSVMTSFVRVFLNNLNDYTFINGGLCWNVTQQLRDVINERQRPPLAQVAVRTITDMTSLHTTDRLAIHMAPVVTVEHTIRKTIGKTGCPNNLVRVAMATLTHKVLPGTCPLFGHLVLSVNRVGNWYPSLPW